MTNNSSQTQTTFVANAKIIKRKITYTSVTATKTYDGTPLIANTAPITSGSLVDGHSAVIKYDSTSTITNVTSSGVNNKFTVESIKDSQSNDMSVNYNITYVVGNLSITPKIITVTFSDYNDLTYNGIEQKTKATPVDFVGDTAPDVTISYVDGVTPKNAATYTATASVADTNYKLTGITTQDFIIAKAPLTVTAEVPSKAYDGKKSATVTLKFNGMQNNEMFESTDYAVGTPTYASADVAESRVVSGTANLNSSEKAANYTLTGNYSATGKITKAKISGLGNLQVGDVFTKVYDGKVLSEDRNILFETGVNDETLQIADVTFATTTTDVNDTRIAKATIKGTQKPSDGIAIGGKSAGKASNYTINADPGSEIQIRATINRKDIKISGITSSDKTYDGNNTATLNMPTITVDMGLVEGDDLTVTTTGTFATANASTTAQTVTFGTLNLGGTNVGNYKLAETGQQTTTTAKINFANITETTATNYIADYDGKPHGITVNAGTTVNSQTTTITYSATADGTYNATPITYTEFTDGAKTVYYKVSAPNHNEVKGTATVEIKKATNIWTTELTIKDITVGDKLEPTAVSTVGLPVYTYYSYSNDIEGNVGAELLTAPTEVGKYFVSAKVESSINFTELVSEKVMFEIKSRPSTGGGIPSEDIYNKRKETEIKYNSNTEIAFETSKTDDVLSSDILDAIKETEKDKTVTVTFNEGEIIITKDDLKDVTYGKGDFTYEELKKLLEKEVIEPTPTEKPDPTTPEVPEESSFPWWILILIAVVVIGGTTYVIVKKNKKN